MSVAGFSVLGGANDVPLRSNSTRSPTPAPEAPRGTRKIVAVRASPAPYFPSLSFVVPCSTGALGAARAAVSLVNARLVETLPWLPAASVTRAVIAFAPSAARSEPDTEKSMNPFERSSDVSTAAFVGVKATPPSSSVTVSPTTAPLAPRPTRITTGAASSAAFAKLSASFVLPVSAGVSGTAGAFTSLVNDSGGVPALLTLPAWSMIRAESVLSPSLPRSAADTVKRTIPCDTSTDVMGAIFGEANGDPLTRSSSVSFTTAPVMLTRKVVVVAASAALSHPSESLDVGVSTGCDGAAGGTVSFWNTSPTLAGPALPTVSVMNAVIAFSPSAPRSGATTTKSMDPAVMSAAASWRFFAAVKGAPLSRSETTSPATAPVPPRLIRMAVELPYSTRLIFPSASFVVEGSDGMAGAVGATVSFWNAITMLCGPALSWAEICLAPSAPRSVAVTTKST